MNIVVIGLSHHTSPVEMRERFAFPDAEIPAALKRLRESGVAEEAVILSTCNRVEIYAATALQPAQAFAELLKFLIAWPRKDELNTSQISNDQFYTLSEPSSLKHLFKVASGMDSMVLGETEILGQIKDAYGLAHTHKHTGAKLNKAFQRAFNVAKHIRTHTSIQRGSVSVASVAVELAEKIFSALADRGVLVIGAGDTSEKVARALVSRGAKNIVIASRTLERAEALAKEFGGRAVPFDDWAGELVKMDIAISSTSAPHQILDAASVEKLMKLRKHRPLLLIDIAVPRDIAPEANFIENVYLYNVDDLQSIADGYMKQRQEEIAICEKIIEEKIKPLLKNVTPEGESGLPVTVGC
ncbi:MAG TPA: glutamyl-tRNA reductase [Verrucomicrobiae bacterium]|jgi:glutamyl-tRNA reductase